MGGPGGAVTAAPDAEEVVRLGEEADALLEELADPHLPGLDQGLKDRILENQSVF